MRRDNGYRFTLQFPANTIEQQQAGEFLERAGSKKSRVVVQALAEYLRSNPALLQPNSTIHIGSAGLSREEVRAMIREELARRTPLALSEESSGLTDAEQEDAIIASMLENVDIFG